MVASDEEKQWHPPLPKESTPNLIMTLPPELSNIIYKLVLVAPRRIIADFSEEKPCIVRGGQLLRVSKQIREEAMPIFCHNKGFKIFLDHFTLGFFESVAIWYREVVKAYGAALFMSTKWHLSWESVHGDERFFCHQSLRTKILTASVLAQAIRELGIDLFDDTIRADFTLRLVEHKIALMQVLKLGKRAHEEGWSSTEFHKELILLADLY